MEWIKVDAVLHFIHNPSIVVKVHGPLAGSYSINQEYIKLHIPEGKRYTHEGYYIVRVDQLNKRNRHKG